ncbi:putative glutathione-dependent formaldehyde-activating enzyme [Lyophyllum shimeji]|uniref:Glutathione-dependent formaldehyde-activating enzyme n=1 Tax=Lyophyllum shimeji TaxID=47721 RepID=A0A9P3PXT2_LYOSH|nr:putative glutathione-dependent formaldehyde-activating enzyme [Lyophyllum shimeji]
MCQRLFSCPFLHTIHYPTSAFRWTHQEPHDAVLGSYTIRGTLYWCKKCGACVAALTPDDEACVWGAQLERDAHGKIKDWEAMKPTAHIYYDTRMLDIDDQLGKWLGYENRSKRMSINRLVADLMRSRTCLRGNKRKRSCSAFVHSIHFSASALKWTHAEPHVAALVTFPKGENLKCKECGSDVAYKDPEGTRYIVWGAQLERDEQGKTKDWDTVKPTAHIFYGTRVVDVDDELGKWAGYANRSERM